MVCVLSLNSIKAAAIVSQILKLNKQNLCEILNHSSYFFHCKISFLSDKCSKINKKNIFIFTYVWHYSVWATIQSGFYITKTINWEILWRSRNPKLMWLKSKKNRGYTGATTTRFCIGSLKSVNNVGNINKNSQYSRRRKRSSLSGLGRFLLIST